MSTDTLKALTNDLLSFGSSVPVLTAVWAAIQDRYNDLQLPLPIVGVCEFARWK
jgi:hypothetical protein